MTTSSDELVGKLSAMTIVGDEDQERVDVNARRAIGCNNTPEEDCQNSIQPTNVVSSDAQTETESKRIDFLIDTLGTNEFSINKPAIRCLLIHFERDIRDIIRRFIHEPSTGDFIWKTMEECYNEAVSPSGTLNAHGFFDYLKDSPCIRSMDSDFESQDHAGNFKGERSWADFWVTVLDCSHGGPTLFCPRNSSDTNLGSSDDIPRYLFRVFDEKSSGINSEQIFESSGRNRYNTEKGPNADLVSLPHSTATDLIFYHLKSKNGEKDMDDNLVSWTSSLLFAIQYALIEKYLPTVENSGNEIEDFFLFRLRDERYYNGEYLSQGLLNHAGRSCVVNFTQLESAGLYRLYPEFQDVKSKSQWADRVLDLRKKWSLQRTTTNEEISDALKIAKECFDASDIAYVLLGFRNRKLSYKIKLTKNPAPSWADKPVEVNRYWQALEILKHLRKNLGHDAGIRDIYRVTQ